LAVSGTADSEPGFNSPALLPVPSAWWETPAVTSCVLAASPESARAARHFTREILQSWGFGDLVDEAETIIGELVVNAVQHGTMPDRVAWTHDTSNVRAHPRAWSAWASQPVADVRSEPDILKLCLLKRVSEVMLAVIDASDDAPTPRQPDWVRESGRGLQIVNALSTVWGWSPIEGHGKAVWAVLPLDLFISNFHSARAHLLRS
jgi:hypothetical protein